jgi:CheY-like chemotaxis protein
MPKILIVEDEDFLSDMYKIKFEQSGCSVVIAHDGLEALDLVKKVKPDVMLLDLVLPGLDGFQVLAKIRKDPEIKNIKVFILSNLGQADEVHKGMASGADGYFIKADLTPTQLLGKICHIMKAQGITFQNKNTQPVSNLEADEKPKPKKAAKILLIEDEETIVSMYNLRFQKSGFEIEVAKNGAWGLKLARQKKFDVIIMDMVMPAMSGYEAIKLLKADESTKDVPIIILSNSAQDKDIAKCKKLGATTCLLKSLITPAKLVSEVEKILNK